MQPQYRQDMQSLYLQGMAGMPPHMGGAGGMAYGNPVAANAVARGPAADQTGRPWGQKIGSNDKYNEWKLFVGQVPLEVMLPPSPKSESC